MGLQSMMGKPLGGFMWVSDMISSTLPKAHSVQCVETRMQGNEATGRSCQTVLIITQARSDAGLDYVCRSGEGER